MAHTATGTRETGSMYGVNCTVYGVRCTGRVGMHPPSLACMIRYCPTPKLQSLSWGSTYS